MSGPLTNTWKNNAFPKIQFGITNKICRTLIGENSNGNVSNSTFINNKLAVAVKDGSQLSLSEINFKENKYDIAVFNKKKEYRSSILSLDKFKDISDCLSIC